MNAPKIEQNDASKAGKRASSSAHFHDCRFEVYAVHTRFDAVQWFGIDNRLLLIPGETAVVAQCDSFDACVDRINAAVQS